MSQDEKSNKYGEKLKQPCFLAVDYCDVPAGTATYIICLHRREDTLPEILVR